MNAHAPIAPESATLRALKSRLEAQCNDLRHLADRIASKFSCDDVHWVHNDPDGEGSDYCEACAEKRVAHLKETLPADKSDEILVDGGWDTRDSDGMAHCEDCGCKLTYHLTTYGYHEEVSHYARNPIAWQLPPSPADAYDMAALLYAAYSDLLYGKGEHVLADAAITVATARQALGITDAAA